LWASIGCTAGSSFVVAILSPRLIGISIAGGSPPPPTLFDYVISVLVLIAPLLVSALGIALGWRFGGRLARRRNAQPSV